MKARASKSVEPSATAAVLAKLRSFESPNVTFLDPDGSWPIVWDRARGVHVWDAEGRRYLDLTAAFGVAAAGHANPSVVRAGQSQMARLLHAMGDVHPHALKAELAEELSRLTFERWSGAPTGAPAPGPALTAQDKPTNLPGRRPALQVAGAVTGKTIFCNSGFEAVEAALKTAMLATGRSGVIAFKGAYHGLGYGALNATHRAHFRGPFKSQLAEFGVFAEFPSDASSLRRLHDSLRNLLRRGKIGAVLVEPVQARGGINIPPLEYLPLLRQLCDDHGALLILDEIYTGFGRTGKWFACEHSGVMPDVVCLGKALTGGFPLSACVGRASLMDAAWPVSQGEAIHTSTFLGHPVGCAMALAQIAEIKRLRLPERSAKLGKTLLAQLGEIRSPRPGIRCEARGVGLMAGVELRHRDGSPATDVALTAMKRMLAADFILLPEGEHSNVVSFTPPLTITEAQLAGAVRSFAKALA